MNRYYTYRYDIAILARFGQSVQPAPFSGGLGNTIISWASTLAVTWPEHDGEDSEVTFELTEQDDEVVLTVTHRRLADPEQMVDVASGWHAHLGVLIDRLNERPPRGFWSAHAAAEREYTARFGPS